MSARLAIMTAVSALLPAVLIVIASIAFAGQQQAAARLAVLSHATRLHQDGDMAHEGLLSVVNEALAAKDTLFHPEESILQRLKAYEDAYRHDQEQLAALPLPPELAVEFKLLRPKVDAYVAKADRITRLAFRDAPAAIEQLRDLYQDFWQLQQIQARITEEIVANIDEAQAHSAGTASTARRNLVVACALVITANVVFLVFMVWSARRSFARMRRVADAVAAGDLSQRIDNPGRDEVGRLGAAINRMADSLRRMIEQLRAESERNALTSQIAESLEMVDTEVEVHAAVARAMTVIAGDRPSELLIADSSRAHLERAATNPTAGAAGCTVESPYDCVAVRRGSSVVFPDSEALNACPRLRGRGGAPLAAVCVPVSFMGRSLGVLHCAGPRAQALPQKLHGHLTTLGLQAGARIGAVRAVERTQAQAKTDSLTGLPNRRSIESNLHNLALARRPYAIALADLDHFKTLNDTYGHAAGDKALRVFAEAMRRCVRDGDTAARWGGEEFALLFPGITAEVAVDILGRIRAELAESLLSSNVPAFTASFGVADSSMSQDVDKLLRIADDALYSAKEQGRDRTVIGAASRVEPTVIRRGPDQFAGIDREMLAANL